MAYASKDALMGASDLRERDVELPTVGLTVKVRGLPAAYSNQAVSDAFELVNGHRGEQTARVNTAKLQELQVLHGLVEPKLDSVAEVRQFAERCGPAFATVVEAISELSGVDAEAIQRTNAMFPAGGAGAGDGREAAAVAVAAGNGGPDLPVGTGA